MGKKYLRELKNILAELAKSGDAKMMMYQTESLETDETVCEADSHFRHNYLKHKTMRRHQKYNLKLLKFAIDAQKSEDCRSRILTIKNGSNPVFEPNILAGVEGLEPSRTVLEVMSNKKDRPNCSHRSAVCATCSFEPYAF